VKTKIKIKLTPCEMCRQKSLLNQTDAGNLICDSCWVIYIDSHNEAALQRSRGWPSYGATKDNIYGTFILLCGLFFIPPTPPVLQVIPPPNPPAIFQTIPDTTILNLDDPRGELHQLHCTYDGSQPLCIEYER